MKRVFVGIDISNQARKAIGTYVNNLRDEFFDLPIRWEKPEKLHITLKFAGSLDENELWKFMQQVKAAAANIEPFRIAELRGVCKTSRAKRALAGYRDR